MNSDAIAAVVAIFTDHKCPAGSTVQDIVARFAIHSCATIGRTQLVITVAALNQRILR